MIEKNHNIKVMPISIKNNPPVPIANEDNIANLVPAVTFSDRVFYTVDGGTYLCPETTNKISRNMIDINSNIVNNCKDEKDLYCAARTANFNSIEVFTHRFASSIHNIVSVFIASINRDIGVAINITENDTEYSSIMRIPYNLYINNSDVKNPQLIVSKAINHINSIGTTLYHCVINKIYDSMIIDRIITDDQMTQEEFTNTINHVNGLFANMMANLTYEAGCFANEIASFSPFFSSTAKDIKYDEYEEF